MEGFREVRTLCGRYEADSTHPKIKTAKIGPAYFESPNPLRNLRVIDICLAYTFRRAMRLA